MNNPKFLDLDDLEVQDTQIKIKHLGIEHQMVVLTVAGFINQQKRATEQQKLAEQATSGGDSETVIATKLIRDSVVEFFPTLPVDELPVSKLMMIFGWLNKMSQEANAEGAAKSEVTPVAGDEHAVAPEGNVPAAA